MRYGAEATLQMGEVCQGEAGGEGDWVPARVTEGR